ncbi:MAG: hypothetical protein DCC55_16680 [Chloroflexi bacterium]|nr:MAG: hypothetical protein DCC55_16680 [Chloroflexota bacterium]
MMSASIAAEERRVQRIGAVGIGVLRYGLIFLLLMYGGLKFFAFEAEGIQPLVSSSPLLGWLYPLLGTMGTSALFGVIEIAAGALIATRRWWPRVSGYASLGSTGIFLVTLSFLFTTPGALSPLHPFNGFLLKDIFLLGAALVTAAEALAAAHDRTA